jgi:hypothetical protein
MTLFTPFLESPSTSKCSKFISTKDEITIATLEQEPSTQKQNRGILSLNKTWEGIIKVPAQFLDGSPIGPKGVLSKWCNDCGVLVREKCKIT